MAIYTNGKKVLHENRVSIMFYTSRVFLGAVHFFVKTVDIDRLDMEGLFVWDTPSSQSRAQSHIEYRLTLMEPFTQTGRRWTR